MQARREIRSPPMHFARLDDPDDQEFSAEILLQEFISVSVAGKSEQTPQYGAIRNSGHDAGDFVFVRVAH